MAMAALYRAWRGKIALDGEELAVLAEYYDEIYRGTTREATSSLRRDGLTAEIFAAHDSVFIADQLSFEEAEP